jgi:hypothetical protein
MSYAFRMQTRLFDDPDLVQFYDIENGWADDDRYCQELAPIWAAAQGGSPLLLLLVERYSE